MILFLKKKEKKKNDKNTAALRIVLKCAGNPAGHSSCLISQRPLTYNLKGDLIKSALLICSETTDFLACTLTPSGYTRIKPVGQRIVHLLFIVKFSHLIIGE